MPDDGPQGSKVLSELDFGTYIAFFLPGALGLYALTPLAPRVRDLFEQIVDKDTTLGATLLLLTGGLIVGTVISGIRAIFLDWVIVWHKPNFNFGSLRDKETRVAYKDAIANTYRFYQFYGNIFLALAFYVVVRYFLAGVDFRTEKPQFYLEMFVLVGLFLQSRKSLQSTYKVMGQILGLEKAGLKIHTKNLPHAKLNQLYDCPLEVKDSVPPIKWTAITSLPTGIALDSCGGLSGTPTVKGLVTLKLKVEDAIKASDSKEFSLKIDD